MDSNRKKSNTKCLDSVSNAKSAGPAGLLSNIHHIAANGNKEDNLAAGNVLQALEQ